MFKVDVKDVSGFDAFGAGGAVSLGAVIAIATARAVKIVIFKPFFGARGQVFDFGIRDVIRSFSKSKIFLKLRYVFHAR